MDKFYPRVSKAVHELLQEADVITPIDVLQKMGLLKREAVEDWRFGRVPYLERVIGCNLSALGRILRLLDRHCRDQGLKSSQTVYMKWGKGKKLRLRFSKSGDVNTEAAYARHYIRQRPKETSIATSSAPGAAAEDSASAAQGALAAAPIPPAPNSPARDRSNTPAP